MRAHQDCARRTETGFVDPFSAPRTHRSPCMSAIRTIENQNSTMSSRGITHTVRSSRSNVLTISPPLPSLNRSRPQLEREHRPPTAPPPRLNRHPASPQLTLTHNRLHRTSHFSAYPVPPP